MKLPQLIELLKMKADDPVQVNLLKSRYNRYASRYNQAAGKQESLQISLYYQLEGLQAKIEQLQASSENL
jgi:hypothetical protein